MKITSPYHHSKGEFMKNTVFAGLLTLFTLGTLAASDLTLEGERWEAKHTGYKCGAFSDQADAPLSHQDFDVQFEVLRTDKSLDNGLLLASFKVDNSTCRYSAILFADNSASTIKLVKSKAYAIQNDVDCSEGKEILDTQLADNEYLYWGHPHHVTIMFPANSAEVTCGEGSSHVGLDFTVSRFLGRR